MHPFSYLTTIPAEFKRVQFTPTGIGVVTSAQSGNKTAGLKPKGYLGSIGG